MNSMNENNPMYVQFINDIDNLKTIYIVSLCVKWNKE